MESLLTLKSKLDHFIIKEKSETTPSNFVLESATYVDDNQFAAEIKTFKQFLQPINSSEDFLISHNKVFHNVCPHRGAKLSKDNLTCPYHGWSFDQDGLLISSTGHRCPYPKGSLKLREVPTKLIGGMNFINVSESESEDFIQEINHFSKDAVFLESITYQVKCNWKLLVESLLETYHFPFAHKSFLEGFNNAFFSMPTSEKYHARIVVPLQNFDSYKETNDFQGINVMYHLFPYSFVLFMNVGFVWFSIDPTGKDSSKITYSLFRYENGTKEEAKKSLDLLEKILDQDFEILEAQQKNIEQNVLKKFHFTHYESLIQTFHKSIGHSLQES